MYHDIYPGTAVGSELAMMLCSLHDGVYSVAVELFQYSDMLSGLLDSDLPKEAYRDGSNIPIAHGLTARSKIPYYSLMRTAGKLALRQLPFSNHGQYRRTQSHASSSALSTLVVTPLRRRVNNRPSFLQFTLERSICQQLSELRQHADDVTVASARCIPIVQETCVVAQIRDPGSSCRTIDQ